MAERMNGYDRRDRNLPAGIIAGAIGGLVGTWAMSEFQGMWSRVIDGEEPQSAAGRHDARDWQERVEGRNANELAAHAVAEHTINRPLTREELELAAPALHYAFGAAMGALYGGLYETTRSVRAMGGTGWGMAVWAGADGIAMPLLNLSRPKTEYPAETHAQSYAAHIVFGVTTEIVRRGVRALWSDRRSRE
jgi:hypothetical protein